VEPKTKEVSGLINQLRFTDCTRFGHYDLARKSLAAGDYHRHGSGTGDGSSGPGAWILRV